MVMPEQIKQLFVDNFIEFADLCLIEFEYPESLHPVFQISKHKNNPQIVRPITS